MTKQQTVALLQAMYAIALNSAGKFKAHKADIQTALKSPDFRPFFNEMDAEVRDLINAASRGTNIELKPIGVALKVYLSDHPGQFSAPITDLITAFSVFFRTGSESSYKKIQTRSSNQIFAPWIRAAFMARSTPQSSVAEKLMALVSEYTGERRAALTREEADDLKIMDLETFRAYTKLRKEFVNSWKAEAQNFVRSSGKHIVPMEDLIDHLENLGVEYQIPAGFTGMVNADLEWFTEDGERIAGVPAFNTYDRVEMNENHQPGQYVFIAVPREGTGSQPKYMYRAKDLAEKRAKKFAAVKDLAGNIVKARNIWVKGVKAFDASNARSVAALLIELSYQFASRIGSNGNSTNGVPTYGLSTARVRHLKMTPTGFTISYLGKDGVPTSHKYSTKDPLSRHVRVCVEELVEGKGPDDPVFTVTQKNGSRRQISAQIVNEVFKAVVGNEDITIHKLRTLKATVLFTEQVDAYIAANKEKPLDSRQAFALVKKFATDVGTALNHVRTSASGETKVTPLTALASYIDVSAQVRLFDAFGLPYPQYLTKALGKHRLESRKKHAVRLLAAPTPGATEDDSEKETDTEEKTGADIPVLAPGEDSTDGDPAADDELLDEPLPPPELQVPEDGELDEPPADEEPPVDEPPVDEPTVDDEPIEDVPEPETPVPVLKPADPPLPKDRADADNPPSGHVDLLTIDPAAQLLEDVLSHPSLAQDM